MFFFTGNLFVWILIQLFMAYMVIMCVKYRNGMEAKCSKLLSLYNDTSDHGMCLVFSPSLDTRVKQGP